MIVLHQNNNRYFTDKKLPLHTHLKKNIYHGRSSKMKVVGMMPPNITKDLSALMRSSSVASQCPQPRHMGSVDRNTATTSDPGPLMNQLHPSKPSANLCVPWF